MQAAEGEQALQFGREEAATEAAGAAAAHDEEQEHDEEGSEEEEDSSSDSEADRREFGIYQALPVEDGEPDWEAECLDVQEYLRRVRWAGAAAEGGGGRAESANFAPASALCSCMPAATLRAMLSTRCRYEAERLPDVVMAPAPQQTAADAPNPQLDQPTSFDRFLAADPGVAPCDPSLKPSAAWTLDFLRQFSQLRRRLQRCAGQWVLVGSSQLNLVALISAGVRCSWPDAILRAGLSTSCPATLAPIPSPYPLLRCREFELTCGQPAAGVDLGGGLRLSPTAATGSGSALDAAAQEELAALSLDPPSALTPELQQLQGQDQVWGGKGASRARVCSGFPGTPPPIASASDAVLCYRAQLPFASPQPLPSRSCKCGGSCMRPSGRWCERSNWTQRPPPCCTRCPPA